MTVLRIFFSSLFKDCDSRFDTADFFCAEAWAEFSSSALIVSLRLMIRFSYSDPFFSTSPRASAVFCRSFYFVYFVHHPKISWPLLRRALLQNQWRESSFSGFLLLLRSDSSSECILNKVQRKTGAEMSDSYQNVAKIACYLYCSWSLSLLSVAQGCFVVWLLPQEFNTK